MLNETYVIYNTTSNNVTINNNGKSLIIPPGQQIIIVGDINRTNLFTYILSKQLIVKQLVGNELSVVIIR